MIRQNFFVPVRYQLRTGTCAGLALDYFYMIHRVGRFTYRDTCRDKHKIKYKMREERRMKLFKFSRAKMLTD